MCYKYLNRLSICIILFCCLSISTSAAAEEKNPLQPMDLSSPRATLKSFLDAGDAGFQQLSKVYHGALGRAEVQKQSVLGRKAKTALDLSEIPPATVFDVSRDGIFYLYDVLSRIELPAVEDIPDKTAYAETSANIYACGKAIWKSSGGLPEQGTILEQMRSKMGWIFQVSF